MQTAVRIGCASETGEYVYVGDIERRSGLYVLGKPGMGKTVFMTNLALKDIENGHGVFFLDPHGDAIEDIVQRRASISHRSIVLLDPEHETHSFCINVLACKDINSLNERVKTYKRAYGIFDKIWPKMLDEQPWLQMVIQNILLAFIENPNYTLSEAPLFLRDKAFRNHLIQNIKHELAVSDFWRYDFSPVQGQAALARLNTLLSHPFVRHIVSQRETTLDFEQMLDEQRVVLIKLSANLSSDIKKFIGTIIISELTNAVRDRPAGKRHQFCIFLDEFQNFAGLEDFSILFNEARKYGIATTIAHQERYGQLADNKAIAGATTAAVNKVFFQLTVDDAKELAPEFAKPPPTESKLERQLVTSQYPVTDLLHGHIDPKVREFVNNYLRPFKERMEDFKDDMEYQRLIRDLHRDRAALGRAREQTQALSGTKFIDNNEYLARRRVLLGAEGELEDAIIQTQILLAIHASYGERRVALRLFDRFFTAIMEGTVAKGQEKFSQFLLDCVGHSTIVPQHIAPVFELYITLMYGDQRIPRYIPFHLAKINGLYSNTINKMQHQAETQREQEKEAFIKNKWEHFHDFSKKLEVKIQNECKVDREALLEYISNLPFNTKPFDKTPRHYFAHSGEVYYSEMHYFLQFYILFVEHPSIYKIIKPYLSTCLAPPWRDAFPDSYELISWVRNGIRDIRERSANGLKYFNYFNPPFGSLAWYRREYKDFFSIHQIDPDSFPKGNLYEIDLLDGFDKLLTRHGEGVIVALMLMMTVFRPKRWRKISQADSIRRDYSSLLKSIDSNLFFNTYNMLYVPSIKGISHIETFVSLCRLDALLSKIDIKASCDKYVWWCPSFYDDVRSSDFSLTGAPRERFRRIPEHNVICSCINYWKEEIEKLEKQKEIANLCQLMAQRIDHLLLEHRVKDSEQLVRLYLLARACHISNYGVAVADMTFPEPTIQGVLDKAKDVVETYTNLLEKDKHQKLSYAKERSYTHYKAEINKELQNEFHNKALPIPAFLSPRILSENEIEVLCRACHKTLLEYDNESHGKSINILLKVLDDFAKFCELLKQPENHIKVYTGQFIEKKVNSRTIADMNNEMAQKLANLPRYTAYAKIIQEKNGNQIVLKEKIRTSPLPNVSVKQLEHLATNKIKDVFQEIYIEYCKERAEIEHQIQKRQKEWRMSSSEEPPSRNANRKTGSSSPVIVSASPDDPPPTHTVYRKESLQTPLTKFNDTLQSGIKGPDMIVIPAGEFWMGSDKEIDPGAFSCEMLRHRVNIFKMFAIGRYAVTQSDYRQFVENTGFQTDAERYGGSYNIYKDKKWRIEKGTSWKNPGIQQGDNHPVVCVSWNDAMAYAKWLTKETGKHYRLLTEAEWEYAARAGTNTTYYWGDNPDDACRYANVGDETTRDYFLNWKSRLIHACNGGYKYTSPVGAFEPNNYGLYDMIGNVKEWVQDCWHENYEGAPTDGSAWESAECKRRVNRSSGWYSNPINSRLAYRSWGTPGIRDYCSSFRLARDL